MNEQEISQKLAQMEHSKLVQIMGTDIDGVLRGKFITVEKLCSLLKKGPLEIGFCGVIFEWDSTDMVYSSTATARNLTQNGASKGQLRGDMQGFPDLLAKIDLFSFAMMPLAMPIHTDSEIPTFLMNFLRSDGIPLSFCPRTALGTVLKKLEARNLHAQCGIELEWYTYHGPTRDSLESDLSSLKSQTITHGMFGYSMLRPWQNLGYFSDVIKACEAAGLTIECFHSETGPGVYEVALKHQPAMRAADGCQLFKQLVKIIAYRREMIASFMAKPWSGLPGCSGHIHLSFSQLLDEWKLFQDQTKDKNDNDKTSDHRNSLPPTIAAFVAGLICCLPDVMPFLAPNVNSYKRLDMRYWAPVIVGWGFQNRLAAVRVICSEQDPQNDRIEVRVPGSDMNPYFALTAILAAGLYGIERQLPLPEPLDTEALLSTSDPAAVVRQNGWAVLPSSLTEATDRMLHEQSYSWKLFPEDLVRHYGMTRLHEIKLFEMAITDWERQRYLELA